LLPDALARFHWKHPGIELTLEIANTQVIEAALVEGRFEIGFTEGVIESDALDTTVFHEDELVAIAPTGHRLLSKKGVTARDLCREPLIAREKGSGRRLKSLRLQRHMQPSSNQRLFRQFHRK
jgi:DNA-binding transcriptional LysR family regulator